MVWLFKRLICFIFPICLVMVAVIPKLFAHSVVAEPEIREVFGFNVCELPCFAGVQLGETTQYEASQLIEANIRALDSVIPGNSSLRIDASTPEYYLHSTIYFDGDIATHLFISTTLDKRGLFERFGAPDCIRIMETAFTIDFVWRDGDYRYMARLHNPSPVQALFSSGWFPYLDIIHTSEGCNPSDPNVIQWRGFANLFSYLRERNAKRGI